MRNLKKVLSLVLALAMVLSICMVGAGAVNYDQFNDKDEITKTEAVAALVNLDVINGYNDGAEFRPAGNVTRAEMVTMICRVLAGGDNMIVNAVKEVPTYSDVRSNPSAAWAESYIEYCTSLGIVSGKGNGIFDPMADVTAAEAAKIVMTAAGYNADIEGFKGIGWDINTMAKANTLKLLNNLQNEVSASQPVTRQQVAQLIYNALTIPMVQNYNGNMANTWIGSGANAYQQTLMEKSFGAKKVTGIVVANEWASLDAPKPIKAGTTKLYVLDNEGDIAYDGDWSKFVSTKEFQDETLTVNVSTTLEQVGSSVTVLYKTDTRQSVFGIVMDSELNHVVEFTKGGKIETKDMEFGAKKGTTYFVNYEYEQFGYDDISADLKFVYTYFVDKDGKQTTTAADIRNTKVETVRVDDRVTEDELELIKAAYNQQYIYKDAQGVNRVGTWGDNHIDYDDANHDGKPDDANYVTGPLTLTYGNNDDPVNNDYTWTKFTETFLDFKGWTSTLYDQIDKIENGNYAKLVDCDNDGIAEFFFEIDYVMDELTSVKERDGEYEYGFFSGKNYIDTGRDGNVDKIIAGDDLAKDDIVVYTIIDGIAYVDRADDVTATVKTVSYRNESITTADGDEYFQSGIVNATDYAEYIVDVDEKVDYQFFFDKYGYIRAYRLAEGQNVYGLLTEAYTTNEFNHQYVKNTIGIVELKAGDEKITEYKVENYATSNPFFNDDRADNNKLTYAQNMLGITGYTHPTAYDFIWTDNDRTPVLNDYANTNVAKYVLTDDGVKLSTASKRATTRGGEYMYYTNANHDERTWESKWKEANPNGNWKTYSDTLDPVMAVDYVQLKVQSLNAGAWRYDAETGLKDNVYVNAVHDTEYYLVTAGGVRYFTDYTNLPKIEKEDVNAMYAVAENTNSDAKGKDYWVANVIVIELTGYNVAYDSIGLLYNNPSKTVDTVRYLDTLNNKTDDPAITLVPGDYKNWAGQWDGKYGFYELRETEMGDNEMSATSIKRITAEDGYNAHGIYAGDVVRVEKVDERGGYIVVDKRGSACAQGGIVSDVHKASDATNVSVTDVPVYVISESATGTKKTLERYDAKSSGLAKGDQIIWVTDGRNVSYIVLVNDVSDVRFEKINWLTGEYQAIIESQNHAKESSVTFYGVGDTNTGEDKAAAGTIEVTYAWASANNTRKNLIVTNGTNVTLEGRASGLIPDGTVRDGQPVLDVDGAAYVLSYVNDAGKIVTMDLVQQAAHNTAQLWFGATQITKTPNNLSVPLDAERIIYNWLKEFSTKDNATLTWVIQYRTYTGVDIREYEADKLGTYEDLQHLNTKDILNITAVVTSENGKVTEKYSPATNNGGAGGDLTGDTEAAQKWKTDTKSALKDALKDLVLESGYMNATKFAAADVQTVIDNITDANVKAELQSELDAINSATTADPDYDVDDEIAAMTYASVSVYKANAKSALKTQLAAAAGMTSEQAANKTLEEVLAKVEDETLVASVEAEVAKIEATTDTETDYAPPKDLTDKIDQVVEDTTNAEIDKTIEIYQRYSDSYKAVGIDIKFVKDADNKGGTVTITTDQVVFDAAYKAALKNDAIDPGTATDKTLHNFIPYAGVLWSVPKGTEAVRMAFVNEDGSKDSAIERKTDTKTEDSFFVDIQDRDDVPKAWYAAQYFGVCKPVATQKTEENGTTTTTYVKSPEMSQDTSWTVELTFYNGNNEQIGSVQTWTVNRVTK